VKCIRLVVLSRLLSFLAVFGGFWLSLAGCGGPVVSPRAEPPPSPASHTEAAATVAIGATAAASESVMTGAEPTSQPALESQPPAARGITLTVWTTEVFSPLQDDFASQLLKGQVADFEAQEPNISVQFTLKKPYGQGGMYDFLQTTHAVVPERLPDVAIVDVADLSSLVSQGMVRPLDNLMAEEIRDDLFPFARQSCTVEGSLFGLPFESGLVHVAFNSELIDLPPLTWSQVLSSTLSYAFALNDENGERVSPSFWLQYLALNDAKEGKHQGFELERGLLVEVFDFYYRGGEAGIIPKSVLSYQTEAEVWAAYLSGQISMVDVSSSRYLSNRSSLRGTGFAAVPTRDGRVFSLAKGWALVILTEKPDRQEAAVRFIEWLLRPEHNGAWARAANRLPAARQSLAAWGQSDPYISFCASLLEQAAPYPAGPKFDLMSRRLQRSLRDVLAGAASPAEAADQVISIVEK